MQAGRPSVGAHLAFRKLVWVARDLGRWNGLDAVRASAARLVLAGPPEPLETGTHRNDPDVFVPLFHRLVLANLVALLSSPPFPPHTIRPTRLGFSRAGSD